MQAAGLTHIGSTTFRAENQDAFFCSAHSFGDGGAGSLFGVFDGHGACGRAIAKQCSRLLPRFAQFALEVLLRLRAAAVCRAQATLSTCGVCAQEAAAGNEFHGIAEALVAAFLAAQEEICTGPLDTSNSGALDAWCCRALPCDQAALTLGAAQARRPP